MTGPEPKCFTALRRAEPCLSLRGCHGQSDIQWSTVKNHQNLPNKATPSMPSPDSYSPLGRWSSIPFSSQMMSWDENQPMIIHDLSLVITEITSPWQQLLNYLVNPQILNQSSMMADSHGTILNSLDCHLQYCNHNKKLQHTTTYYHQKINTEKTSVIHCGFNLNTSQQKPNFDHDPINHQ